MRYIKKPKYKLDRSKVHLPKEKRVSAEEIYKEALMEKMRKRKRR